MDTQKITDISYDSYIEANPRITLQEESDRWGILYDPEIDFSLGVSPECVLLWKQLKNGATIHEMTRHLKQHFHVPQGFEQDIAQLVKGWINICFVTPEKQDTGGDHGCHR